MASGSGILLFGLFLAAVILLWLIVTFSEAIRLIFIKGAFVLRPLLRDFEKTILDAERRLMEIPEAEIQKKPVNGKWSKKEMLGHLIDSASNNHQRFVRAQFSSEIKFPTYEQAEWVRIQDYQNESWPSLVKFWSSYNLHLLHIISSIPPERLKGNYFLGDGEPVTLEYLIRDYVQHLKHHLAAILPIPGSQAQQT